MKRILYAIILVGICASCQKSLEISQKTAENGLVSKLKVTASIDASTKVSFVEDDQTHALKPSWEVGDIIIGFDGNDAPATYGFTVTEVDGNTGKATLARITEGDFKGTATSDPADGTKMYMFYAPGAVMDSIHVDKKEFTVSIKEQGADVIPALMMAQAAVENNSVSLQFKNQMSIIAIKTPKMATANKTYTGISLFGSGVNTEVKFSVDDSGTLVAEPAEPGRINKRINVTSDAEGNINDVMYIVSAPIDEAAKLTFQADNGEYLIKDNRTLVQGNYYYMTSPAFKEIPADVIPGGFSVKDANGVISIIFFSKGNLYATNKSSTDASYWGFEANQYDYRTYSNRPKCTDGTISKSGTASGHWGLFGWSTSTNYGRSNATANISDTNFIDWGELFGSTCSWKTLTREEWKWLIGPLTSIVHNMECRKSSKVNGVDNARFMKCTVKKTKGVLLFPDVFRWPEGEGAPEESSATKVNVHSASFADVIYSIDQFKMLESAGAVFLPAAGYRRGSTIYYDGGVGDTDSSRENYAYGLYWSSTAVSETDQQGNPPENINEYNYKSWAMHFDGSTGVGESPLYKNHGLFVRLVTEVE